MKRKISALDQWKVVAPKGPWLFFMSLIFLYGAKIKIAGADRPPRLVEHIELRDFPNSDYDFIALDINSKGDSLAMLFRSNEDNALWVESRSISEMAQADKSRIRLEGEIPNLIDFTWFNRSLVLLAFDKVYVFNREGRLKSRLPLAHNYTRIHKNGAGLFGTNAYNFENDSSLQISELLPEECPQIEACERIILSEPLGIHKVMSHFNTEAIMVNNSGFFIADPIKFQIRKFNFKGKQTASFDLNSTGLKLANSDSLYSLYLQFPKSQRKLALSAIAGNLKQKVYLEKMYAVAQEVWLSLKIEQEGLRVLWRLDSASLGIKSVDTLVLEPFDRHWQSKWGDHYRNSFFPLRLDLGNDIVFTKHAAFTVLDFNYFPEGDLSSASYFQGFETAFAESGGNYSLLEYAIDEVP